MAMTECLSAAARLIVAAILVVSPAVTFGELDVHDQDGVPYVSGGVGSEERRMLQAMSEHFDLKLTMALTDGHFVSDVRVRIQDSYGDTLVDTVTDGPFLLAQLIPGAYTVSCREDDETVTQTVHIDGGRQQQLTFTFSAE